MFESITASGSDTITIKEFQDHLSSDIAKGFLVLLDIDETDAWMLFNMIDTDGSHSIDAEEFVDGCMRLKGPVKAIDFAVFRKECTKMNEIMKKSLAKADANMVCFANQLMELQSKHQEQNFGIPSTALNASDWNELSDNLVAPREPPRAKAP